MRVLVVNTMAPFIWGGAEELAINLVRQLKRRGVDAELMRLPFRWDPAVGIPAEIARFKSMRLPNVDRVVAMKFPAYLIPAERKMTWLIHQYRQAYDMWDSPYCNIRHDLEGEAVRNWIVQADNEYFQSQRRVFTISNEVSSRLKKWNNVDSLSMRAPLNDPALFQEKESKGYILAPGRINSTKRQHLLVEAMRYLPRGARLIVAGPPETIADAHNLERLVERYDLSSRVKLDMRFLPREQVAEYVNNATAVAYLPYKEDSYGYVTMEAFQAGKPVITCDDAGELLEIVKDQRTGRVVPPDPKQLAEAMAAFLYVSGYAQDLGGEGGSLWRSLDISWDSHIAKLLEADR